MFRVTILALALLSAGCVSLDPTYQRPDAPVPATLPGAHGEATAVVSQWQQVMNDARLKSVDADILKIDGSFIRNIVNNSLDYQIVASICHLARMKKMLVVAEYVETEEIRSAVHALGIDYVQGYLIGKPVALESLLEEEAPCEGA